MRIENGQKIRSKKGSQIPTKMIGFRAEPQIFEMIERTRKSEGLGRSEFIIRVLTEYCKKNGRK